MHYQNGKEAKKGDLIIARTMCGPLTGVVIEAPAGNSEHLVIVAPITPKEAMFVNASECLLVDDALPKTEGKNGAAEQIRHVSHLKRSRGPGR